MFTRFRILITLTVLCFLLSVYSAESRNLSIETSGPACMQYQSNAFGIEDYTLKDVQDRAYSFDYYFPVNQENPSARLVFDNDSLDNLQFHNEDNFIYYVHFYNCSEKSDWCEQENIQKKNGALAIVQICNDMYTIQTVSSDVVSELTKLGLLKEQTYLTFDSGMMPAGLHGSGGRASLPDTPNAVLVIAISLLIVVGIAVLFFIRRGHS